MNIVLIGYRGSGKTAVGKRLAERLQRRFMDTDNLLEQQHGTPISEIIKSLGWDHFRALERSMIEEISKQDHLILAPGGGAVLDAENVTALRKNGLVIWLKADGSVLRKRLERDSQTPSQRPTLTGKGTLEELEEVMISREPLYERAAHVQLDTSAMDVGKVVGTLISILQKRERS